MIEQTGTLKAGKAIRNETRYFEFTGMTSTDGRTLERFKPVNKKALAARFPDSMIGKDDSKRYRVSPELAEFERAAREAKIGLWSGVGDQAPVPPWEFRKQ